MTTITTTQELAASVVTPTSPQEAPRRREAHAIMERLRKPVSYVAIVAVAWVFWATPSSHAYWLRMTETILSFSFVVLAVLGRLWCGIHIAGRKNTELCTSGPYAMCRNPLYFCSWLGAVGVVLAGHKPAVALIVTVLYWGYYWGVILGEEERLRQMFGATFDAYCQSTPRMWPRFQKATQQNVSLVVALRPLKRSFGEVVWFFVAWMAVHIAFAI